MEFPKKSFKNTIEELKNLPNRSGLYYLYDKDDTPLYVGKAKNLKSRMKEHHSNNLMDREGKFYLRIQRAKKYRSQEEWPEALDEAFRDFQARYLFHHQSPLVIDMIFHRVKRIEIEEMPHELTKGRENELIQNLKPPFNSKTASDEYYEIFNGFND